MVAGIVICLNLILAESSLDITKFTIILFRYIDGSYLTVIGNN